MALLFAMVLGADSIDDCDVLRAGRTRPLLAGWIPAPSTLDVSARVHVRARAPVGQAAWGVARGRVAGWRRPGEGRLVTDVNSFIGELCGRGKHGAAFGYTRLGDHPILDHAG